MQDFLAHLAVEQNAALAELFSEYLILSQKILDRVLLVSVNPAQTQRGKTLGLNQG